jgi:hypothetical protein
MGAELRRAWAQTNPVLPREARNVWPYLKPGLPPFDRKGEVESISHGANQSMRKRMSLLSVAVMLVSVAALGTDDSRGRSTTQVESPDTVHLADEVETTAHSDLPSPAAYGLPWLSINNGGQQNVTSTNYGVSYSVGQATVGEGASTNFRAGIGFWYGITGLSTPSCTVALTGDVNLSGNITSSDIIVMINFVFKSGLVPMPCEAAGDANCSGSLTAADIIELVNFVFKGGAAPCDVCTLIPGSWSCP